MNEMSLLAIHIKTKSCKLSKIKTKTKLRITPILHVSVRTDITNIKGTGPCV